MLGILKKLKKYDAENGDFRCAWRPRGMYTRSEIIYLTHGQLVFLFKSNTLDNAAIFYDGVEMGMYEELNIEPVINAAGTLTSLGGSLMEPKTIKAMGNAAENFVVMDELMEKASAVISKVTGAEDGLVTSGCAASLVYAAAACMTGRDVEKVHQVPDTSGMKKEVVIHRTHRNVYDRCLRNAGVHYREIGNRNATTRWELESAMNEQTAAVVYFDFHPQPATLPLETVIDAAHEENVPVIVDAAAELPPIQNLQKYTNMGADLVGFSGGKQIRGPNDTGILCGREDLIKAAKKHAFPNSFGWYSIGRPMKVSKEQIVGLIVALQQFVTKDFEEKRQKWRETAQYMATKLDPLSHVKVDVMIPERGPRPLIVPRAIVSFDEERLGVTTEEVKEKLLNGTPRVAVHIDVKNRIQLNPQCLKQDEEQIVVNRMKEVLQCH